MNTKINTTWDKRDLRKALGSFGTGVTVVTSGNSQSRWVGVTANSFSSVSLEPPIVLWSLVSTSPNLEVFDQTERFVINVLGLEQVELSKQFSKSLTDKFAGCGTLPM
jgi:flavin reductase (DIM6/NTAB) family NADH-FMN oxidoreductase RutF